MFKSIAINANGHPGDDRQKPCTSTKALLRNNLITPSDTKRFFIVMTRDGLRLTCGSVGESITCFNGAGDRSLALHQNMFDLDPDGHGMAYLSACPR